MLKFTAFIENKYFIKLNVNLDDMGSPALRLLNSITL